MAFSRKAFTTWYTRLILLPFDGHQGQCENKSRTIVPRLEKGTGRPIKSEIVGTRSICDTVFCITCKGRDNDPENSDLQNWLKGCDILLIRKKPLSTYIHSIHYKHIAFIFVFTFLPAI